MKTAHSKDPTQRIPRLNSLLHRLQQNPGPEDQPYLDQLMSFLQAPPPGTRDRWKEGAKMCTAWGFTCSGAAVWRLYQVYALEWRVRLGEEAGSAFTHPDDPLEVRSGELLALRTYNLLADPEAPPACLVSLARIQLRREALEFERDKYSQAKRRQAQRAVEGRAAWERFVARLKPGENAVQPGPT